MSPSYSALCACANRLIAPSTSLETTSVRPVHHLSGCSHLTTSTDQTPAGVPFNDESDEDDSDLEGYDLRDVSSDVEVNPDELEILSDEDRFEEVNDDEPAPKAAGKKRARESDTMEVDGEEKVSKAQKKKQKKQKGEDGKAVPTTEESTPAKEAAPEKAKKADKKDKKEKKEKTSEKEKTSGKEQELSGGIKIVDAKVGDGPKAKNGDSLSMRYIGKLQNGKVFDSNKTGAPVSVGLERREQN